jgi:hypothetical protein
MTTFKSQMGVSQLIVEVPTGGGTLHVGHDLLSGREDEVHMVAGEVHDLDVGQFPVALRPRLGRKEPTRAGIVMQSTESEC